MDGYEQLMALGPEGVRGRVRVQFLNDDGEVEPGVDGGGLFKVGQYCSQRGLSGPLLLPVSSEVPCPAPQQCFYTIYCIYTHTNHLLIF
jgi:hypothetical protein